MSGRALGSGEPVRGNLGVGVGIGIGIDNATHESIPTPMTFELPTWSRTKSRLRFRAIMDRRANGDDSHLCDNSGVAMSSRADGSPAAGPYHTLPP